MRYLIATFLVIGLFIIPWIGTTFPQTSDSIAQFVSQKVEQLAAVVFSHNPVSVIDLKYDYVNSAIPGKPKIKVLLVPGHEPEYGGAEFGKIKERDLTVELSEDIAAFLGTDDRFQVIVSRDKKGWNNIFSTYFRTDWDHIIDWQKAHKDEINYLTKIGEFKPVSSPVEHNDAPGPVATRLYGISRWSNENSVDITIHIHFNDYPRQERGPGKYEGFAIYVPESQYYNSSTTKVLAQKVFDRMAKYSPVSDFPGEAAGIVEDQELIATGAFNSVDSASMLIEYAYLYEPQITNEKVRDVFLQELAYETYLGLIDFFEPERAAELSRAYDTLAIPYEWDESLTGEKDDPADIFALQTALMIAGHYPPPGETLRDCPRTGRIGACTKAALKNFKKEHSISETAPAGELTLNKLNELFSRDVSVAPRSL